MSRRDSTVNANGVEYLYWLWPETPNGQLEIGVNTGGEWVVSYRDLTADERAEYGSAETARVDAIVSARPNLPTRAATGRVSIQQFHPSSSWDNISLNFPLSIDTPSWLFIPLMIERKCRPISPWVDAEIWEGSFAIALYTSDENGLPRALVLGSDQISINGQLGDWSGLPFLDPGLYWVGFANGAEGVENLFPPNTYDVAERDAGNNAGDPLLGNAAHDYAVALVGPLSEVDPFSGYTIIPRLMSFDPSGVPEYIELRPRLYFGQEFPSDDEAASGSNFWEVVTTMTTQELYDWIEAFDEMTQTNADLSYAAGELFVRLIADDLVEAQRLYDLAAENEGGDNPVGSWMTMTNTERRIIWWLWVYWIGSGEQRPS
jgi:hypothetical protein